MFSKMSELGKASARYFREVLPYALTCYRNVFVATHVPPFVDAALYNDEPCGAFQRPFYTNISAGCVIRGITSSYKRSRVKVLCGHTHTCTRVKISAEVEVLAGGSEPGRPKVEQVFNVQMAG